MIQRQKKILIELKNNPMDISQIAKKQNVTERTIRNDIKSINENLEKFNAEINKDSNGLYKIFMQNKELYEKFEKQELLNFEFDYSEPKNRIAYIA
ncbi:HTH domain-containing protein, partial [Helcococcus ovis]